MLNHIVLMGRLTRDPELRRTASGISVVSFTIAVDRDYGKTETGEKETDFIDIVAWRSTAEFVSKYFSKGRMVVISGRLQIRSWTDKDGNKRRSAEVVAENVYFGESKRDSQQTDSGYGQTYGGGQASYSSGQTQASYSGSQTYGSRNSSSGYQAPVSDFAMLEDDDSELPF